MVSVRPYCMRFTIREPSPYIHTVSFIHKPLPYHQHSQRTTYVWRTTARLKHPTAAMDAAVIMVMRTKTAKAKCTASVPRAPLQSTPRKLL